MNGALGGLGVVQEPGRMKSASGRDSSKGAWEGSRVWDDSRAWKGQGPGIMQEPGRGWAWKGTGARNEIA